MKKYICLTYCLLMILISSIFIINKSGDFVKDLIGIFNPKFTLSEDEVQIYCDNDKYQLNYKDGIKFENEDDLAKHRQQAYEIKLKAGQQGAARRFISNFMIIIIGIIIIVIHSKIAKKEYQSQ